MTDKNDKTEAIEADVLDKNKGTEENNTTQRKNYCDIKPEILSRVFFTVLFAFIGWASLWVFAFVVLIQFGFLLITGQVNSNLKGFNKEVGMFLNDMIRYLSFQTNEKPFPFRDWPYGDKNKSELNEKDTVKASK